MTGGAALAAPPVVLCMEPAGWPGGLPQGDSFHRAATGPVAPASSCWLTGRRTFGTGCGPPTRTCRATIQALLVIYW